MDSTAVQDDVVSVAKLEANDTRVLAVRFHLELGEATRLLRPERHYRRRTQGQSGDRVAKFLLAIIVELGTSLLSCLWIYGAKHLH